MSDWERVKAAYRLETFIPGLKKVGKLYKMCCPFHTEKSPSFVVDPVKQTWRCYGACNEGGDLFAYAVKANGWTLSEALRELASRAGIKLDKPARKEGETNGRLLGLLKEITHFYHETLLNTDMAIPAMDYLINTRGLNVSDLEAWQIGYAPDGWQSSHSHLKNLGYTDQEMIDAGVLVRNDEGHTYDRFRHRIMFPIHDDKGRVRGFSARVMPGGEDPKYINSPQSSVFDKSSLVYGLHRVRSAQISTQKPFQALSIVEGQMDAICAHKHGFTNVCAQMGTALTDKQIDALSQYIQRLVLCLDNDNAGQTAMHKRARDILATGSRGTMDIRIASLETYKDPDELIRANPRLWTIAMNNARPIVDVMIEAAVSDLPSDASVQDRTNAAKKALDLLRSPDNPMETVDNIRKLAAVLSLPENVFVEWATPQLRVLPKAAPLAAMMQREIPREVAILWGIMANTSEGWLQRANATLMCLAPIDQSLPYAFAPLSTLDFTYDLAQHLFTAFVEHGDETEDALKGTALEAVFNRVMYKPLVMAALEADTPLNQPRDTYEEFIDKILLLRLYRLKDDMDMFIQMGDTERFKETMHGIAWIQHRRESIKI